ncbi:non-specific lipid-transfer protein-like [Durio zibethinus]|uniref:Non-specific lipid-transfer protein-like n=1 Tax=Durio zibethinus TaxID=66656 RepID=A0A6P5WJQ1_DURZI|nr:non-specific lipid-transfer protein-like [Durio zibethinus]
MGKKMMGFSAWFLLVLGLVFLVVSNNSVNADTEATCLDCVVNFLNFCRPYLVGKAATPDVNCCIGLSNTVGGITKPKTRKDICECLHYYAVLDGDKPDRAKQVLKHCNIEFPVPLAPSADDCKNIH